MKNLANDTQLLNNSAALFMQGCGHMATGLAGVLVSILLLLPCLILDIIVEATKE